MSSSNCACGNPKEDWQSVCKSCYSKNKGNKPTTRNKDKDILKQVCLKVASQQLTGAQPIEIVKYAQSLEIEYTKWA